MIPVIFKKKKKKPQCKAFFVFCEVLTRKHTPVNKMVIGFT